MAAISQTHAALRFNGDDLNPDDLSARLRGRPSSCARKGDVVGLDEAGRERVALTGRWMLSVERRAPGDLDAQIQELFGGLTDDLSVWRVLAGRYTPDLFVGLFLKEANEGIGVGPLSLALLAERGVSLNLNVFAAADE